MTTQVNITPTIEDYRPLLEQRDRAIRDREVKINALIREVQSRDALIQQQGKEIEELKALNAAKKGGKKPAED